jgi:HTH-type transcriptional regulator / antitoxin HigA
MNYKVIKTNKQYESTLARVSDLIDLSIADSITNDQLEELDLLGVLVEKYEDIDSWLEQPTPLAMINFCMEQKGLNRTDMQEYLGSKSKVSEVLRGKISLSLTMIKKLHAGLNIPFEALIEYETA